MGRTPRIKKEPFGKDSKNQNIKKRTRRVLMESLLEFTSDEGKVEVSRLLPLDTLYPEDNGVAIGDFAEQSA